MRWMIIFGLIVVAPWFVNVWKFTDCDFESNWKCEAIHGAGVFVPPLSWITVWFADDSTVSQ